MQPARRAGTDLLTHDAARVYPRAVRDFPCDGIGAPRYCGINSLVPQRMDRIGVDRRTLNSIAEFPTCLLTKLIALSIDENLSVRNCSDLESHVDKPAADLHCNCTKPS